MANGNGGKRKVPESFGAKAYDRAGSEYMYCQVCRSEFWRSKIFHSDSLRAIDGPICLMCFARTISAVGPDAGPIAAFALHLEPLQAFKELRKGKPEWAIRFEGHQNWLIACTTGDFIPAPALDLYVK